MCNLRDAYRAANMLGISFDKFTVEEFLEGLNIEKEQGMIKPQTNVTNDDLIYTTKIALAHLNEFPNYYNLQYGLRNFETILRNKLNKQ